MTNLVGRPFEIISKGPIWISAFFVKYQSEPTIFQAKLQKNVAKSLACILETGSQVLVKCVVVEKFLAKFEKLPNSVIFC